MAGPTTFRVTGLRELLRVTDQLPKDVKREVRKELRVVAEPVKETATQLFIADIIASGKHDRGKRPDLSKVRYGISVRKVGTITVESRVRPLRKSIGKKRPKFTDLVLRESLDPAVERNEAEIMAGFNRVLDSLERRWTVGR